MSHDPAMASSAAAFVTDAVMLRATPYGEADRIVTLYTRAHGKVAAMARSAQKSRARFGGALGLFVLGEATLKERPGADLMTFERFDARRDFTTLGGDVLKMAHASYATELLRELTVPRHADAALLDLIVELYAVLLAGEPRADTLRAFELRLLGEIGLQPALDRCVACGSEDPAALDRPGAVVDPARGGLLCAACAPGARGLGVRPLPAAARLRLLEAQGAATLAEAAALPVLAPELGAAAREAMHALVATHLHQPIKSLEFLRKLASAGKGA